MYMYVTALRRLVTATDTDTPKAYDRDADDRGHGILTENDWEILLDEGEGRHPRQYRRRLRQRVRNAMLDFRVLFDNWPANERDQAFVRETDDDRRYNSRERSAFNFHADDEIHDGCVALVGLLFQQYHAPTVPSPEESFRVLLETGIERAVETMDTDRGYVVEIEPVEQAVAEAREKYQQGERVDVRDLSRLVNAGDIPAHDIPLRRPENNGGDGQ